LIKIAWVFFEREWCAAEPGPPNKKPPRGLRNVQYSHVTSRLLSTACFSKNISTSCSETT